MAEENYKIQYLPQKRIDLMLEGGVIEERDGRFFDVFSAIEYKVEGSEIIAVTSDGTELTQDDLNQLNNESNVGVGGTFTADGTFIPPGFEDATTIDTTTVGIGTTGEVENLLDNINGGNGVNTLQVLKSTLDDHPEHQQFRFTKQYQATLLEATDLVDTGDACGKSETGKISGALRKFFKKLKKIRKYGKMYVDEVLSDLSNIRSLIKDTSSIIAAALRTIVQRLRNFIIEKVRTAIDKIVDKIFTTLSNTIKQTIVQQTLNLIICKFEEILDGLADFVSNFLNELVGKVINIPLCAAQQFANALINNLAANIDRAMAPILDGIGDLIGGIGRVAGSIFSAIDKILAIESFLCLEPECPEITEINTNPSDDAAFQTAKDNFASFIEVPSSSDVEDSIGQWIDGFSIFGEKISDSPDSGLACNTDPFKCGPPTIEIFGGGGIGAAGSAIVDHLGHLIGINLDNGGTGYTTPPFVAIIDACDHGQGASAYSEINNEGVVVRIIIVNTGNGYDNQPTGGTEFDDVVEDTDVISGIISDYNICLDGFEIISTGIGYSPTDEITITPDIPNLEVSVSMNDQGQIIEMQILDSVCGITEMPDIDINSLTGAGIEVRPILSFNRIIDDSPQEVSDRIVEVPIGTDEDTIRNLAQQRNIVRVIDCVS